MEIILNLDSTNEQLTKAINIIKSEITPLIKETRADVKADFSAATTVPFMVLDKPIIDEKVLIKLNSFITNFRNVDVAKNLKDNLDKRFKFEGRWYNANIEINDILDYAIYLKDKAETETETSRAYISNLESEINIFLFKITPFTLGPSSPKDKYEITKFILSNRDMQKWKTSKEAATASNSRGGKRRKSKRRTIKQRKSKRRTIKQRKSKSMKKRKYK